MKIEFTPHSAKQDSLIHSDTPLTITGTGTQWGKSIAAAWWMIRQLHVYTAPDDKFLIMAPTYKIMEQSALPYFLTLIRDMKLGVHKPAEDTIRLHDGRVIFVRSERDKNSIVGIPRVRAYWLDEAGLSSLYFHENIQARAASADAVGLYTTSPYSRNWLYKNYVKPAMEGKLASEGITLIRAASWDNPYHSLSDPIKRAKMQAQMDPTRFAMLFGGEWGKKAGLVYDCFDETENICAPFRLPNGTRFFGGIDWGHTEPFALVVRAITPDGRHYQCSEFYKTGMTVPAQMEVARQKMVTFGIKQFYCGHERPENIMLFNQNGLPAVGVPEKDIQVGTDLHYELIKTRRYKVMAGTSPYTMDEYDTYHYPEAKELKEDDDSEDDGPVGQNDHCMSANRFVTLRTYRSHLRIRPYTPDEGSEEGNESQEARLKRLTRPLEKTRVIY